VLGQLTDAGNPDNKYNSLGSVRETSTNSAKKPKILRDLELDDQKSLSATQKVGRPSPEQRSAHRSISSQVVASIAVPVSAATISPAQLAVVPSPTKIKTPSTNATPPRSNKGGRPRKHQPEADPKQRSIIEFAVPQSPQKKKHALGRCADL
jgi:hypothetical protein